MTKRERIAQMFWSELRSNAVKKRGEVGDLQLEMNSSDLEVASDFLAIEKRLRRVEQHLKLPPLEAH